MTRTVLRRPRLRRWSTAGDAESFESTISSSTARIAAKARSSSARASSAVSRIEKNRVA